MVLANFIARASAAASQVLQGFDDAAFSARLRKCVVAVAFDDRAAKSAEGVVALKLAVDMLARLYPAITFLDLGGGGPAAALVAELKTGARAIHGRISFDAPVRKALCCVAVGDLAPEVPCPTVFVGSDGWTARLSPTAPRGSADSRNPFGAAAAACFGVANVFRIVFGGQLANGLPDDEFEFDVLHLRRGPSAAPRELPFPLHLGAVHLAGQGAIGRAACWTLSRVPGLEGTLDLVDDETIDRSNLQRYVGAGQRDIDAPKAASAAAMFAASTLRVVPHAATWGGYMAARGNWALDKVAVALDTARDRMAIQAALPRRVLNAWTQPGDLGVSRHGFLEGPCLMCLYLPDREVPHESVLVAEALNLPEREVRLLLHTRAVVDHHLAARIATARGVQLERLRPFVGLPLASFYAKAVCGSTVFAAPDGGTARRVGRSHGLPVGHGRRPARR